MRSILKTATTVLAVAAALVLAPETGTAQNTTPLNAQNGIALHGYDPVAYQTDNKPVKGNETYTAVFEGVTYRFANRTNMEKFKASPAAYAPAYGGYCAYGVAVGGKYDIDPAAFTVVKGTLYMNKNLSVRKKWLEDVPGNIEKADKNWPTVRNK